MRDAPEGPNVARLAEYLKVLGNPNRLELLHALRSPRSVREIELRPESVREGENPDRAISHQAVRDHLARLRELGVLTVQRVERDGGIVDEYALNHAKLFAIVEELRGLGELRSRVRPAPEATLGGAAAQTPRPDEHGPHVMLVRGQGEGRVFPLRKENLAADRGWILGRKPGLAVSLDYDPFVSSENAEILQDGRGFVLHDLPQSRNGTSVNFEPLPRGGSARLGHGDVVSLGRTHLVFRER